MANSYKHLIITRFNLRNKDWDNLSKNANPVLTHEWLEERFVLFTDFCFPSIIQQVNQNFEWWVYFDQNTPPSFRTKIRELSNQHPIFKPFFIDGMDAFLPQIQLRLKDCAEDYIITSRLDNDDALHENYTAFVQKQFCYQDGVALDLIAGYTLQIEPSIYFGFKEHLYNPFISYIEKNIDAQSVWKQSHTDWKRSQNVQRFTQRLWLSVIHKSNKVNDYTGYGKPEMQILKQFHISTDKIQLITKKRKHSHVKSIKNMISNKIALHYKDLKKRLGKYK